MVSSHLPQRGRVALAFICTFLYLCCCIFWVQMLFVCLEINLQKCWLMAYITSKHVTLYNTAFWNPFEVARFFKASIVNMFLFSACSILYTDMEVDWFYIESHQSAYCRSSLCQIALLNIYKLILLFWKQLLSFRMFKYKLKMGPLDNF